MSAIPHAAASGNKCDCSHVHASHRLIFDHGFWLWKCGECDTSCGVLAPHVHPIDVIEPLSEKCGESLWAREVAASFNQSDKAVFETIGGNYLRDSLKDRIERRAAMAKHPSGGLHSVTRIDDDQRSDLRQERRQQHLAVRKWDVDEDDGFTWGPRFLFGRYTKQSRLQVVLAAVVRTLVRRQHLVRKV